MMLVRCCLALLALALPIAGHGLTLTYRNLVAQTADLEALAVRPRPGETCRQFSSYDRRSRILADGRRVGWEANQDWGNFLRQDPEGAVLADMAGPGAVLRIWAATPRGTLKIFLDGAPRPALSADLATLGRGLPGVPRVFCGMQGEGLNLYLPIPYQRRCRVVVAEPRDRFFYHVDYRTFPPGTRVAPFRWPLPPEDRQALAQAATRLINPPDPVAAPGARRTKGVKAIPPGKTVRLALLAGPAGVTSLALAPELPRDGAAARRMLAGLVLAITFDGAPTPQVLAPLGHFFGSAPGRNAFRGYALETAGERFHSRWYMPFARSAAIQVRNVGAKPVPLCWEVVTKPLERPFAGLMHFHAAWRREFPAREFDWRVLETAGPGRFVGMSLAVWNPDRSWWGEGDEKVWVDAETFPSWYGTGTEDYLGYAWGCRRTFSHPFHAHTLCEGPRHANWTSAARWQIADNIPFCRHLRMTLENYGRNKDYATVAWWYAAPEARCANSWPQAGLLLLDHRPIPAYREPQAVEGEGMRVLGRRGIARLTRPEMGDHSGRWSGEHQLLARASAPRGWVDLALPIPKRGRYAVSAYLTRGPGYGRVSLLLSGRRVKEEVSCRADTVRRGLEVPLGVHYLRGKPVLRVEVSGKGRSAGLDCVVLRPARGGLLTRIGDWLRGLVLP